jgi:CRISPR-associated endonuclease/helicase Cas3
LKGLPTTFWGKLRRPSGASVEEWHPLCDHCADVAACCTILLRHTLLRKRLARLAGLEVLSEQQITRLGVLAALHDIGKFNHGFQNKAHPDAGPTAGHVGEVLNLLASSYPEQQQLCEALQVSTILSWGTSPDTAEALLHAAISHHGRPVQPEGAPKQIHWQAGETRNPVAGVADLVTRTRRWFPTAWELAGDQLPDQPAFHHAFSGLVMLADWLGSDERFFPSSEPGDPGRFATSLERASAAVRQIGLEPGAARHSLRSSGIAFEATFGFPPRGVQETMLSLEAGPGPSLTILEAETGSGKTEAALARYLALFEAGEVDGVYFALPTRTAATQIHSRVVRAVKRAFPIPDERPPVVLAVPGYLAVDDRGGHRLPGFEVLWDDDEAARFRYRAWAAEHPKRYLAGAVVVGTIDQVLLSTLAVNHSHMRATALLRQFLIVDEVHASDAYMNRLLAAVLERHWEAGGHALLMSATLGIAARTRFLSVTGNQATLPEPESAALLPYPAVLHRESGPLDESHAPPEAGTRKRIRLLVEPSIADTEWIADRGLEAAQLGARVLIIRNTVRECIETQEALESHAKRKFLTALLFSCAGVPAPHHARFARDDRLALDHALEATFGAHPTPAGCVAVATQTVQQSLDIDADLLITDLCPMDVLLQRIGRLHRHPGRLRPPGHEAPTVRVLVPAERDLTPFVRRNGQALGPHGFGTVYEDLRILEATWRTLESCSELEIPEMNRSLVEAAIHPKRLDSLVSRLPEPWLRHSEYLQGATLADRRMAARNLADWRTPFQECSFPSGDLDRRILTRLGEGDRLAIFAPPVRGPFGVPVRQLTIPAWLARGVEPDAKAEGVTASDTGISFLYGRHRFRYDRLGLRRDSDDDGGAADVDLADA